MRQLQRILVSNPSEGISSLLSDPFSKKEALCENSIHLESFDFALTEFSYLTNILFLPFFSILSVFDHILMMSVDLFLRVVFWFTSWDFYSVASLLSTHNVAIGLPAADLFTTSSSVIWEVAPVVYPGLRIHLGFQKGYFFIAAEDLPFEVCIPYVILFCTDSSYFAAFSV